MSPVKRFWRFSDRKNILELFNETFGVEIAKNIFEVGVFNML